MEESRAITAPLTVGGDAKVDAGKNGGKIIQAEDPMMSAELTTEVQAERLLKVLRASVLKLAQVCV